MKKIKCEVCEKEIDMNNIKSKVYQTVGRSLITGSATFDTIDCPNCGCPIILKARNPRKLNIGVKNADKK